MLDLAKLTIKAGDGGHGRVSFRREKYEPKGGPDGGNGGDGGSVIIRAESNLATLEHLSHKDRLEASSGQMGGKRGKTGAKGEDKVVTVPVGTTVWLLAENEVGKHRRLVNGLEARLKLGDAQFENYQLEKEGQTIPKPAAQQVKDPSPGLSLKNLNLSQVKKEKVIELDKPGQELVVCQGGFGGRGNDYFKSSSLTTPMIAEYGTPGEQRVILLELKMLADVGLVGLPNAGKSTFLSRVTKARPKVGSYPFTTLKPHLGVMSLGSKTGAKGSGGSSQQAPEIVVADIPGLIAGASQGSGLGFDFLRHVEGCRVLVFLLFLEEAVVFDEAVKPSAKADLVWQQFQTLRQELEEYSRSLELENGLTNKPFLVALNKIDVLPKELVSAISTKFTKHKQPLSLLSTATGQGMEELKAKFRKLI